MSRYQFVDENFNTYNLDGFLQNASGNQDVAISSDGVSADIKIIEKTFRDGGIFNGIVRLKSNELEFSFQMSYQTDVLFQAAYNELLYQARKTVLIKDLITARETPVVFSDNNIKYETGCQMKTGKATITFKRLSPFWETSAWKQYNLSGSSASNSGTLSITNNGKLDAQSIITIDAHELITKILFHIPATNEGIYIKDLQFGQIGLTQYVIDNTSGKIELSGYKRNQMIQSGTGFFVFPPGTFDLDYNINGDCDINIAFKERYYI